MFEGMKTPTEIAKKYIQNPIAALSGPNLSVEIMLGRPAMAGIAGDNALEWTKLFTSQNFKTIVEEHPAVLEFGGAAKNIIALGAGLFDGYYENNACNAMGSFVAFALEDIEHIFKHKHDTALQHPSFIGDLFATCMSETSRNHEYGHKFGAALRQGKPTPKPEQTVEGIRTLQMVQKYSEANKIPLPTINALYNAFYKKGKVEDIISTWQ
jgi:glycerol-3-phosphate dehydrogenase (NAD(P)+)